MTTNNGLNESKKRHKFILFVSGMSFKSMKAIENINEICNQYIPGDFEIEIIDVYKDPKQAVNYQVVGLPTLVRVAPEPRRTILGDLSEKDKVLEILDFEK